MHRFYDTFISKFVLFLLIIYGTFIKDKCDEEMVKITTEERKIMNTRIYLLIGTPEMQKERVKGYDLSDTIRNNMQYRKMYDKLVKVTENHGMEALNMTLIQTGNDFSGFTPKGKRINWYGNHGYTERSRYCGTLIIDGETIFTSGTIAKCYEYMLNN